MFESMKRKIEEKREEKAMFKERYQEELKTRKAKAIRHAAVKRAKLDAQRAGKAYAEGSGMGQRMMKGFDEFGKEWTRNLPRADTGFQLTPFPEQKRKKKDLMW